MRWPVDNWEKWYLASKHGRSEDYGKHDGVDVNLLTGGDTDLNQPLYAICDGTVSFVHLHGFSSGATFGNHFSYEIKGPWGTYWSHYAHCNEIYVKVGDKVKEGQKLATVGKTGRKTGLPAHLHWAIKTKASGPDDIANNQQDLDTNWADPISFVEKWRTVSSTTESMPEKTLLQHMGVKDDAEGIQVYDKEKKFLEDARAKNKELETKLTEAEGRADARLNAIEDLSVILHCEPNVEAVKAATQSTVKDNSEKEQKIARLEKTVSDVEKEYAEKEIQLRGEIKRLKDELKELRDSINSKIDGMETRVDRADAQIEILPKPETKVKPAFDPVAFIISLFKRN